MRLVRFFRNMAYFDVGYLTGVVLGGLTVAVLMTAPKLISLLARLI